MKTLLVILTGQHVPNLVCAMHTKPDRIFLLETPQMEKRHAGENFRKALAYSNLDFSDNSKLKKIELPDSSDLQYIQEMLRDKLSGESKERFKNWTVCLNGGKKIPAIGIYEFFSDSEADIVYFDIDTGRPNLMHVKNGKIETTRCSVSARAFLAGYGYDISEKDIKRDRNIKNAEQWWELSRVIAEEAVGKSILNVDRNKRKRLRESRKKNDLKEGMFRKGVSEKIKSSVLKTFGGEATEFPIKIDKHAGKFLTGEWLEAFIYNILRIHTDHLGIREPDTGIHFKSNRGNVTNELDVTFMKDNNLYLVECKSGAQEHTGKSDVLYKLDSIKSQLRGLRISSFLATTSKNIMDKADEKKIHESVKNRAVLHQCRIIPWFDINAMAREPENFEDVGKAFDFT